jgi:predicted lactoylglutathione lyase
MVAMQMQNEEQVQAFYAKAMELGATDDGPPGQRISNFYAGYFRDLDGNKLNAFCFNDVTV